MTLAQTLVLWIMVAAFVWYAIRPVGIYLFGVVIQELGKRGKFFTTLPDLGRFLFIVVGGRFERTVENVIDWDINPVTGIFEPAKRHKKADGFFEKRYGVTPIGLFGEVKVFPNWQWAEFRQKRNAAGELIPEWDVMNREENVRQFLHQFTLSVPTSRIELLGNDQASTNSLITVLVIDPETAFFKNKNWVDMLIGFIQSIIKDWASDKEFLSLKDSARADQRNSELTKAILDANRSYQYYDPETRETRGGGFLKILGVQVVSHFLQSIEATGDVALAQAAKRKAELEGEAAITAATKAGEAAKTRAELEGDAAITKATKEALALKQLGEAKRKFIEETIVGPCGGPGPHVAEILKAQALTAEGSRITTFVERGGNITPALPIGDRP